MFGGLAIIVPVLTTVANTAPPENLTIVLASILVFSIVVALFSTLVTKNLLAATAVYAAVLTVFVSKQSPNY